MGYKRIIPQMFDVRPVDETGGLDWEKIQEIENISKISQNRNRLSGRSRTNKLDFSKAQEKIYSFVENPEAKKATVNHLGLSFDSDDIPIFFEDEPIRFQKLEDFSLLKAKRTIRPENFKTKERNKYIEDEILKEKKVYFPKEKIEVRPFSKAAIPGKKPISKPEFVYEAPADGFLKKTFKKLKKQNKNPKNNNPYYKARREPSIPKKAGKFSGDFGTNLVPLKTTFSFAITALFIAAIVCSISLVSKSLKVKEEVLGSSQTGYNDLTSAITSVKSQNFEASSLQFDSAYATFSQASSDLSSVGDILINVSKYVPYASQLSSGKNMIDAGSHIALAGQALNKTIETMKNLKNPLSDDGSSVSLLDVFQSTEDNLKTAQSELDATSKCLDNVKIDDLPQDKQSQFLDLKNKLPGITSSIDDFLNNSDIFTDILGGNGPRKYLFLFQNNSEMRATGGFIGSYGLLDINNGRISNFKIDGIFNPDGQLQEKIVPPIPIQKISAAWSLHDSNWFPDFPTSAQKAISFFEKTGGPTADGVITLTPTVMQKLLEITGPIEMKDYGITLDSDNFVEQTQDQVENKDKDADNPKQILSDLAPILLDKLFNAKDIDTVTKTVSVLSQALDEKQILLYSQNKDLEKLISSQGWSGEVLNTPKDYLSVINTNINGYKTDAVVKESITHESDIASDGSVTDTVTVTRQHNGGDSQYDWFNQVNDDYMRIYVPQGSKLLSADGQTRETDNPPLDYDALNFKRDPDVQQEEQDTTIDPSSGTRIYDEANKTVFANWVYVSPKESVTITYKYLLPFKIDLGGQKIADSYSLLAQKQSGSLGSQFTSTIDYPQNYSLNWSSPDNLEKSNGQLKLEADLTTDKFIGTVFTEATNK